MVNTYVVIYRSDDHCSDHQQPVRHRNIYLIMEDLRFVNSLDMGEIGYIHHLNEQLETAGDHSLRSDNGGKDSNNKTEVECSRWDSIEEWIRIRNCSDICVCGYECCLSDIG